jgi:hypothetical protein
MNSCFCNVLIVEHIYALVSMALDWEGQMEAMAPMLSGPNTHGFLFLGVCEANRL